METIMSIGIDCGRGYTKAFGTIGGQEKSCIFKSLVGQYNNRIEFENYETPIAVEIDGEKLLFGYVAEKECGNNCRENMKDSKITTTAQQLIYAVLSQIAEVDRVKIALGVPNNAFSKTTLKEVQETYKGKRVVLKDLIKDTTKIITIEDVTIFRESDSALLYVTNTSKRQDIKSKPLGLVSVGYRTTEYSYFNEGLKYNNNLSGNLELGNLNVLRSVLNDIKLKKTLNEIDSSNNYNELKEKYTSYLIESISQKIDSIWIEQSEMEIYLAGGTALNFKEKDIPNNFKLLDCSQMASAKGLYLVAEGL